MSSDIMRVLPGHCFDVHVLRTSKQNFVVVLLRLEAQYGQCRPTESIQEVIRALNVTMRDVEEAWRVWRHDPVRAILRSGFEYIKARIRAACWRRYQGLSPAAFVGYQSLYPAFRYAGTYNNQPRGWQAEAGPVIQVDEVSTYHHSYGNTGDYTSLAQPSDAPYYPELAHTSTHAVSQQFYASPQSASVGAWDYYPPPYPPPQSCEPQQQPLMSNVNATLASGSPPLLPAVSAAVEVATRFLEAINKAVNICIELNAM